MLVQGQGGEMVAAKDSPNTKAKGGRTLAVKEIKRP